MSDVVNLNRERKKRAKAGKDDRAAANREKHGRSKTEKAFEKTRAERRKNLLDGAKIEPDDDGS